MIIGLLKCDNVTEEFVQDHGDYDFMFAKALNNSIQWKVYEVHLNQFPESEEECEGYIITGAGFSTYENLPWIFKMEEFIRNCCLKKIKIVGICFGHQIIAQALGGKNELSKIGWGMGVKSFSIILNRKWMNPSRDEINLYYSHQDQVTQLPKNAICLGGNFHCPHAMYEIGNNVLALQGHPEFSAAYAKTRLTSRPDIDKNIAEQALPTFSENVDNELVNSWIINFFKQI